MKDMRPADPKKKHILLLAAFTLLLSGIFVLAYLRMVPTEIKAVPFYDSIGHFVLYGTWGYLLARVFDWKAGRGRWAVPLGILVATAIAVLEESSQALSSVRTFSLFDLGWGLAGIVVAGRLTQTESTKPAN